MPRTKKTCVILIAGKAGSGKTTTAEILEQKLQDIPSLTIFRYSFANPIKYIAQAFGEWKGEKDEAGRAFLQNIGKVFREYNKPIWVKHFLNQLDKKAGMFPFNFAIVDDWRFPDEIAYLQKNPLFNVVTIRIFGRGGLNGEVASDVSENSLPEADAQLLEKPSNDFPHLYDFAVENSGDVESLSEKLDTVLAEIEKQYIVE
jgi:hypothetical protein